MLHAAPLGAYATGTIYAAPLIAALPDPGDPVSSVTDIWSANDTIGNLLPGMPMSVAANDGTCGGTTCPSGGVSGQVATGWDVSIINGTGGTLGTLAATASLVTGADGRIWQQIVLSGSVTVGGGGGCAGSVSCVAALTRINFEWTGPFTNVSAGDNLSVSCAVQIDPGVANVVGVGTDIFWSDSGTQYWNGDMDGVGGDAFPNPPATIEGINVTPAFQVPATSNVYSQIFNMIELTNTATPFSPAGTFRFGDCAMRKDR